MDRSSIDKFNWRWFMDLLNFKRNRPLLMNWQIRVSFKGGTQSSNSSYESIYWSIDSGSSGSFFVAQMFVCQVHWKANAVEHDKGGKTIFCEKYSQISMKRKKEVKRGWFQKLLIRCVREARFKLVHNTSSARSSTYFHLLCVRYNKSYQILG